MELARYFVSDCRWGEESRYSRGTVVLSRRHLEESVLEDPLIDRVTFDLAHPGDQIRINRVLDVIEPRTKTSGEGVTFPGIESKETRCGFGRTNALSGFAIVSSATFQSSGENMLGSQQDAIIDMSPSLAHVTPFARTQNLVVTYHSDCKDDELLDDSIRRASVRLARSLAQLTTSAEPDTVDIFGDDESDPTNGSTKGSTAVKFAYVCSLISIGPLLDTFLYGRSTSTMALRWVSSGDLIDGALVSGDYHYASQRVPTYLYQCNPIVEALHQRAPEVAVAGVVLTVKKHSEEDKRQAASEVLDLLRQRGVGAVCTHPAIGGNAQLDPMYVVQACEASGISAGIMVLELGGADGDDFGLVDFVREADLIVTTGNRDEPVTLPAGAEVYGSSPALLSSDQSIEDEIVVDTRLLCAATSQVGALPIKAVEV